MDKFEEGRFLGAPTPGTLTDRDASLGGIDEIAALAAMGVVHDFKNVLAALGGSIRIIQRHAGKRSDLALVFAATGKALAHGNALADRLLLQSLGRKSDGELLDVSELIASLRSVICTMMDPNTRVIIEAEPGLPMLQANRLDMERALLNLVSNARDAMPAGGILSVCARQERSRCENASFPFVRLCVEDTGNGMDSVTLRRATEAHFTTSSTKEGRGLGLWCVKKFATEHGGELKISSRPGEGTKIELCLPSPRL